MSCAATQGTLHVDVIRQFPGKVQAQRAVKVMAPGKHFPGLQPTEQRESYEATAVEFKERHKLGIPLDSTLLRVFVHYRCRVLVLYRHLYHYTTKLKSMMR